MPAGRLATLAAQEACAGWGGLASPQLECLVARPRPATKQGPSGDQAGTKRCLSRFSGLARDAPGSAAVRARCAWPHRRFRASPPRRRPQRDVRRRWRELAPGRHARGKCAARPCRCITHRHLVPPAGRLQGRRLLQYTREGRRSNAKAYRDATGGPGRTGSGPKNAKRSHSLGHQVAPPPAAEQRRLCELHQAWFGPATPQQRVRLGEEDK